MDEISKVTRGLTQFAADIKHLAEELAIEFKKMLLDDLHTNANGFKLAAATIAKRQARGNDSTTPLLDFGDYAASIIVEHHIVKVMDGYHYSGMTYGELSLILEHGRPDEGIPAFPLWEKTIEKFIPIMQKRVKEVAAKYNLV